MVNKSKDRRARVLSCSSTPSRRTQSHGSTSRLMSGPRCLCNFSKQVSTSGWVIIEALSTVVSTQSWILMKTRSCSGTSRLKSLQLGISPQWQRKSKGRLATAGRLAMWATHLETCKSFSASLIESHSNRNSLKLLHWHLALLLSIRNWTRHSIHCSFLLLKILEFRVFMGQIGTHNCKNFADSLAVKVIYA